MFVWSGMASLEQKFVILRTVEVFVQWIQYSYGEKLEML